MHDSAKLLLRLAVGGMMLLHGIAKIRHGIGGIEGLVESHGLPGLLAYGVYVGEVVAPILLLLGYFTRPAALVLAFNMLVAVMLAHPGDILRLGDNGEWAIELQMFYLVGSVCIALLGSGRYALSRGLGRFD